AERFPVGNLRLTHVCLNLELPLHPVDEDVEVKLTHTRDNGLSGLGVQADTERRVLFGQLLDSSSELLLVTLGVRLNRYLDDRFWETHGFENDRCARVAERVAGRRILEAHDSIDVPRVELV